MKKVMMLVMGLVLMAQLAWGGAFEKDDIVVFLGDSITYQARWTSFVARYYYERMPERNVTFYNAGVPGDRMTGCLGRLDEDVTVRKPTVIVTMFGMNDVGWGLWAPVFGERENERKDRILKQYESNLRLLAKRLKETNPRARRVWCTPSIYDETAEMACANNPGRNRELLAGCAEIVKRFGKETGEEVIDFNGPMTAFNADRQKKDPTFTLVGPDRVHPLLPGAFFMGCTFLRQQGLDPHVGDDPLTLWRETDLSRKLGEAFAAERLLRDMAASRWYLNARKVDANDLAAVTEHIARLKAEGKTGYFEDRLPTYLNDWPRRGEIERTFQSRLTEAREMSRKSSPRTP